MKILLTNHSLKDVGGTEKWTYTMAQELQRRLHEVEVFTFMRGTTSEKIEDFFPVVDDPSLDGYDLIMSNHNTCLSQVQHIPGYKVHTCHGPKHQLEQPVGGADAYVAVSPEVRKHGAELGFKMKVIGNALDLDMFAPPPQTTEVNVRPRVLSMCKAVGASNMIEDCCKAAGFDYDTVHYLERPVWDTADLIKQADIVVGVGRTALEGLACGKAVFNFDGRTKEPRGDGWITNRNVDELSRFNFSSRATFKYWTVPELTDALLAFRPQSWSPQWVRTNANITDAALRYLSLVPVAA